MACKSDLRYLFGVAWPSFVILGLVQNDETNTQQSPYSPGAPGILIVFGKQK